MLLTYRLLHWSTRVILALSVAIICLGKSQANDLVEVDSSNFENLQSAIDALPSSGGVVRIAAGEHRVHAPLRIRTGDTTLIGVGGASNIVNVNEDGQPTIVIENPKYTGKPTPNAERLWRVAISNLRITGNKKSGHGVLANYVEELLIDRVSISYHGGDGLHLNSCYEDPRICNSLFTYNLEHGIFLSGCHDIVVSANQFEENRHGIACLDSFNLTMTGNNLDDHLGDGVIIENTYGSVIASNMIEECQGWAIVINRDAYGITLSANVIAHEFTGGIDLRDAHGCTVTGNTFTIVKNTGLAIRKGSGSITVSGNNFSDSWIGRDNDGSEITKRPSASTKQETRPNEATGILLDQCEAIVITGNLFSRLSGEAIQEKSGCKEILTMANGEHRDTTN